MPHSLRAKLSGLRYKGILEDKDYKRLCHALDLEKAEQEPCKVTEYDKDHIWYKGGQYISLRRFLEVKAEAEKKTCEDCDYSEIMDWEQDAKTGKAKPIYWCERHKEPCDDVVSRKAVEDKLLKLCNELEGIFANIRMQNQDESVCGLCEYDCPAPYECPGFDIEDCFKLADERRHKWQSTKELPSVRPQEQTGHWTYIRNSEVNGLKIVECSKCGKRTYGSGNYCPNCGAKMVEPQESEDKE